MPILPLRFCLPLASSLLLAWASPAAVTLRVGQNFTGATYGIDSFDRPPDAGLAVGPSNVVEFINGRFSVFTKTNGSPIQTETDDAFWRSAGVSVPSAFVSDPRILFDAASQRWFASMVDVPYSGGNRFLLAVSANADPTGTWNGVAWTADSLNGYLADFPTLGIDATGVYLSGDMFDGDNPVGSLLNWIPKQDLLASPPSVARLTSSGLLDYATYGMVLQPAVTLGLASTPEAVLAVGNLGTDLQSHSNLVAFTLRNAVLPGDLALSAPGSIFVPPYTVPIDPPQPGGADNLDDGDARFSAVVYRIGDVLYATHSVEVDNRAAIQWFQVNATNQTLIQSGTITDPVSHLFYPAIAANAAGTVVIVFNSCGTNSFISSYAMVGEPSNGSLTFGNPVLLKAGLAGYRTNITSISRWGDYSAISPDPSDPTRFWSLTQYPSSQTAWSTQITELITSPLVLALNLSGTNAVLSWSASAAGFQLQSTPSLVPANWTPVPQPAVLTGNQYSVALPMARAAAFFQLVK
ncbi:MAG TPA: hypothetical protein VN578_07090 [Candidatus Binatia bacterium]|nr:hypothetical protein [Candidatus Binatia bacterium]